jgi:hypothetical protein
VRNPVGELTSLAGRLRYAVPWTSDRAAFLYVPALAILTALGAGLTVAGCFWHLPPAWHFSPWALAVLVLPACTGFFLTYFHDLLQVRLGWRALEVLLQFLLSLAAFSTAGVSVYGILSGLMTSATVWVIAVRVGSDLLFLRPDRLQEEQIGPGHRRLVKHHGYLMLLLCTAAGVFARYRSEPVVWSAVTAAAFGAALCVSAGLVQLSWAAFVIERQQWRAGGEAVISDRLASARWRDAWRMVLTPGVIAMILPANISPLARLTFDSLFERINTVVAPFFVRTGPADSRSSSELAERLAESLDAPHQFSFGSYAAMLLTVLAVLWVIKRFLPLMGVSRAERLGWWERDRGLLRWLWDVLREWWRRMTGRLLEGEARDASHMQTETLADPRISGGQRRGRRVPSEPRALVRFLYARFLERAAGRGWRRRADETAGEFGARMADELSPGGAEAMTGLTGVYESVRYGSAAVDAGLVTLFRRHAAVVFRLLRRRSRISDEEVTSHSQ